MNTKKLRQKILDLAIRGKLVPQDPNDEPASVLLERIRAEKERLIKEGKIKRSKKSVSDDEIEAPFEIPESWEWCKLSDIASYGGGKTPSMENKQYWSNGTNLWVTSKDMKYERISDSFMKISDDALPIMTQYEPGTLLLVTRSGILRHSLPIAILEKKATVNQDLKTISLYFKELHEYIYYAIKARESFILKEYHKDGTTVDSINFEKFSEILIPIPPLAEQRRIVNTIERWFALIDELESNEGDLVKAIDQAKSKILDLAIHGKLVPQDPNDEPALALLKRINPKFEPCDKDNCSFELPNSWEWTTIGKIASSILYGVSESAKDSGNYKLLRITDIQNNKVNWKTVPFTDFDDKKALSYLLQDGDILFARTGATVGKSYLVEGISQPSIYASYLIRVQTSNLILPTYIKMFFDSGYYWEQITLNSVGIGQPNVNGTILAGLTIPIPPYQEQIRIVAKIKELFTVLDSIKESLE